MSALTQLINKGYPQTKAWSSRSRSSAKAKTVSEICWGITAFLLFLALGPFSAIAVVFAVFSLVSTQEECEEPKAIARPVER